MRMVSAARGKKTFSDRFNYMLDLAEFRPLERGRAVELAQLTSCTRMGARRWLQQNTIPEDQTLRIIVVEALTRLKRNVPVGAVIAWLREGREVRNPFEEEPVVEHDAFLMLRVNAALLETLVVMGKGIQDLETLPTSQINKLMNSLYQHAQATERIDKVYIEQILRILL